VGFLKKAFGHWGKHGDWQISGGSVEGRLILERGLARKEKSTSRIEVIPKAPA